MPYADPEAQRRYQREWRAQRRANYFADKSCVRCGSHETLRLDHVDPRQKVSHNIWSWSQIRREVELAKCQVLCEPCHKEKNLEDLELLGKTATHGGIYMYRKGCRCPECEVAKIIEDARER